MHLIGIAAIGFLVLAVLGREGLMLLFVAVVVAGIFVVSHAPVLQTANSTPVQAFAKTPEECNAREPNNLSPQEIAMLEPECGPPNKTRACEGPLPRNWNDAMVIKHRRLWNCPIHGSDIGTPGD